MSTTSSDLSWPERPAEHFPMPPDWQRGLDRFRLEGLTNGEIAHAMKSAIRANPQNPWLYACKLMWDMVDSPTPIH